MGRLLKEKDINLLINSRIINDHPELQSFIKETPTWDDRKLEELDKDIVLYFKNIHPKVESQVSKEWAVDLRSVEYFEGDTKSCELCGHRPIKNICVIENKFTKKRLKVGTECVKHFEISKDVNIEELIRESKKIKRLAKINSIYPGIEKEINNWDLFLDKQDILVKREVRKEYVSLGEKAKKILKEYIDDRTTKTRQDEIIEEMDKILKSREVEIEKIKNYVNNNKNKLLIPSRELINRLKASNKWDVVRMLKNDGIIRHRTLFRVEDEEFSKSLVDLYNKRINDFDFNIDEVVTFRNKVGYKITYKKKNKIKLFCSHNDLCFHYYNFITGDEGDNISFKGLIEISKVYGNSSVESVLYELFGLIRDSEFELSESEFYYDIYHDYNEFYVYNREDKCYYELTLSRAVNEFVLDLFMENEKIADRFYNYLVKICKKPISKEDMEYIREMRE